MKYCPGCVQTKAVGAFGKNRSKKDGLGSYCLSCMRARCRASRHLHPETNPIWREKNKDRIRERNRRNPRRRAYMAAYMAVYQKANAEKINASHRRWYRENIEIAREQSRVLSHRRRLLVGEITGVDVEYMRVVTGDPCSYCGLSSPPSEVDHILPLSRGGDAAWQNLTAACRRCNASKSNHRLLESAGMAWFLAKRDREKARAVAFLAAQGTDTTRRAKADEQTATDGKHEEAEWEALKAVVKVLETRASIGQSLLRAQGKV